MAGKVTDRDMGWKAMSSRISRATTRKVLSVGILEAEGDQMAVGTDSGLTVCQLGEIHEFGLGVPQRSFIRDWFDGYEQKHREQFRMMGRAIVRGEIEDWDMGLARLGLLYVAEIQARIKAHILPELEEATIKAKTVGGKEGDVPLIDTGQLWGSITSEVK